MTTGTILDKTNVRMILLMRRICKAIVTTGSAEFSMVKQDSGELWFEGKIVVKNGQLAYANLTNNCPDGVPQQLLVNLNDWYVELDVSKKGAA